MFENAPNLSVNTVAEIVKLAVAPVFLLSGIASFVKVEPMLLASQGEEHDRWLGELRVIDLRMRLVSWAISLSVLSAVLICTVVVLLFSASLSRLHVATAIALLFIGSMVAIGVGFAIFLVETRVGSRAVRVRSELLQHTVDDAR